MVHALEEASRVLGTGGQLFDLRPLAMDSPLEVLIAGGSLVVGHVRGAFGLADDIAAERALREAVAAGRLVEEGRRHFAFDFIWDDLRQLRRFLAAHWCRRYRAPSDDSLATAGQHLANDSAARLRVRQILKLGRYRSP